VTIEESPIEKDKDMNMEEAGGTNGNAGDASGETTRISPAATSESQEYNENGKRRRSEIPEALSVPGDWSSRMERTIWQQTREVAQLHRTIENLAKILEAHAPCEEAQWLGKRTGMEEREKKWDEHHNDDVVWVMGITGMHTKVMARAAAAPRHEERAAREMTAEL